MTLLDTSILIESVDNRKAELLLEKLAGREFIFSCDVIEREIEKAIDFLRKTDRKKQAEKLRLLYEKFRQGSIKTSSRIQNLANQYHHEIGGDISKKEHKNMENDFLIVASASVGGVRHVVSLNRKTMTSSKAINAYKKVNQKNAVKIPTFIKSLEELERFVYSI